MPFLGLRRLGLPRLWMEAGVEWRCVEVRVRLVVGPVLPQGVYARQPRRRYGRHGEPTRDPDRFPTQAQREKQFVWIIIVPDLVHCASILHLGRRLGAPAPSIPRLETDAPCVSGDTPTFITTPTTDIRMPLATRVSKSVMGAPTKGEIPTGRAATSGKPGAVNPTPHIDLRRHAELWTTYRFCLLSGSTGLDQLESRAALGSTSLRQTKTALSGPRALRLLG